ncbi:MAG: D-alanyl-D-alanine carboxypeptidase family protein [Spirochaetota bacterium]
MRSPTVLLQLPLYLRIAGAVLILLALVAIVAELETAETWFAADPAAAEIVAENAEEPETVYVAASPVELQLNASEAVLIDVDTDTVLYSHGSGEVRSLASLTKLVTMYVILDLVERGELSLEDRVTPVPEAYWTAMPARSSVLFLGVDQRIRIETLLLGLSIASGNDAAIALAYHVDGSVPRFAERMEEVFESLGASSYSFSEPSGIEAANRATASDFARFVSHYLRRFPDATPRFHEVPEMVFPTSDDYGGRLNPISLTHANRNLLLREYPAANGLKTGFTYSAGYSLAASAERDGRRIAAVILGVDAPNARIGSRLRTDDAVELFDYAFETYESLNPGHPELPPVKVRGGVQSTVPLAAFPPGMLIPRDSVSELSGTMQLSGDVVAPVRQGQVLGEIEYSVHGEPVAVVPVSAARDVEADRGIGPVIDRLAARAGL